MHNPYHIILSTTALWKDIAQFWFFATHFVLITPCMEVWDSLQLQWIRLSSFGKLNYSSRLSKSSLSSMNSLLSKFSRASWGSQLWDLRMLSDHDKGIITIQSTTSKILHHASLSNTVCIVVRSLPWPRFKVGRVNRASALGSEGEGKTEREREREE